MHILKDSGKRQNFSTGAVRDTQENKGRYDLISPIFTKRLALVMERGQKKYGERNWELGLPLARYLDSAKRHLDQFVEGERGAGNEDHLAQAAFNIMACLHTEEMIRRGLLPKELNNLPDFISKKKVTKDR